VSLVAIQQLLGHRWLATTMAYVHVSSQSVEEEYRKAAERSADRFRKG
jgi:site-specific recombinase XerD